AGLDEALSAAEVDEGAGEEAGAGLSAGAAVADEATGLADSDSPDGAEVPDADADEEEEEDEEEASSSRLDESTAGNFLALYFKEMAALSVLRPEEEVSAAQEIERLEIALWAAALGNPHVLEFVLEVAERAMENSLREFEVLRKSAKRARES